MIVVSDTSVLSAFIKITLLTERMKLVCKTQIKAENNGNTSLALLKEGVK
jgi:hypothetical protein